MDAREAKVVYTYKAGIRYRYTMSLVVATLVSGWFCFFVTQILKAPKDTAGIALAIVMLICAGSLFVFVFSRMPRSFEILRSEDGLFIRVAGRTRVRLKSTSVETKTYLINRESYARCHLATDNKCGKISLCFHHPEEAFAFVETLKGLPLKAGQKRAKTNR